MKEITSEVQRTDQVHYFCRIPYLHHVLQWYSGCGRVSVGKISSASCNISHWLILLSLLYLTYLSNLHFIPSGIVRISEWQQAVAPIQWSNRPSNCCFAPFHLRSLAACRRRIACYTSPM